MQRGQRFAATFTLLFACLWGGGGLPPVGAHPPATPLCFGRAPTITGHDTEVAGTAGDDVILLTGGSIAHGMAGNDRICGVMTATGGPGDDRIAFAPGYDNRDEVSGGGGNDLLVIPDGSATVSLGSGHDRLLAGRAGGTYVYAGSGNDVIRLGSGPNEVYAGAGDDVVVTRDGRDQVSGDKGNDTLRTGAGNDFLDGGAGTDIGRAGAGRDVCTAATEERHGCDRVR